LVASDAEFQPRWPNWLSGLVASIAAAQLVGYLLAIVAAVLLPGGHPPAFAVILIFLFYAAAAFALPAMLVGLATIWARRGKVWSRRRLMFISTLANAVCILVAATLIVVLFPWLPGQLTTRIWTPSQVQDDFDGDGKRKRLQSYIPHHRRLAAILAADIAGYSALMGADKARTVRDLKEHQAVVLPMIGEFGGHIIDTAGDGILAELSSVVNAFPAPTSLPSKARLTCSWSMSRLSSDSSRRPSFA
jgi:hypothetical protein